MAVESKEFLDKLISGDYRTLARAITAVENGQGKDLMPGVYTHTGKALVIGITGSPGAGKSSLVDKLAGNYRQNGEKVGILCIDPSSPFSGGAILGDRIRMSGLGVDNGVFIRSMATRGQLGGLARATVDAAAILDAAGFPKIIIETVGVGQDEVEVVKAADISIVVLVPGMGDDIQAIKAGIMEIGDLFVINKADRDGVLRTQKELEALLALTHRNDGWNPPIVKTIATENKGIDELAAMIEKYREFRLKNAQGAKERLAAIARWRIIEILSERLLTNALAANGRLQKLDKLALEVAEKRLDPYSAVDDLLNESQ
jgi:LAO/AO transport system kinase